MKFPKRGMRRHMSINKKVVYKQYKETEPKTKSAPRLDQSTSTRRCQRAHQRGSRSNTIKPSKPAATR
uniref:Uncharacterized protein n=1 Tax=Cucumis melo TaxID=3656 RepID=A0A9I9E4T5_CUCME